MSSNNDKKRFWYIYVAIVLIPLACLFGLAEGLFYGWVISPVVWVDTKPDTLAQEFQEEYLRMAIDSFVVKKDCPLAIKRYEALGENGQQVFDAIIKNPGVQKPNSISAFSKCVGK